MITPQKLIENVPAIQNMLNAIASIKIMAEVKIADKYEPTPEDLRLNQILKQDGANFLSRMYLNYITYGKSLAYKVKTRRAVMNEMEGNPIYDYKDGAVAGLHVPDRQLWEIDEDAKKGNIKGAFINRGDITFSSRNYLNRREFIYLTDWNHENRPIKSIGSFIEDTLLAREPYESISDVLGIDSDLLNKTEGGSIERHQALIKRAMEDTIIPAAHQITVALKYDLGLHDNFRLILNAGDPDNWVNIWENSEVVSTSDHIIYV